MVGHQAVAVQSERVFFLGLFKQEKEQAVVVAAPENGLLLVAAAHHVVRGAGVPDVWFPGNNNHLLLDAVCQCKWMHRVVSCGL